MIRRLLVIAACLGFGGALVMGLYWAFLNTPEANALTLAVSVLLIVLMIASAAVIVTASLLLAQGMRFADATRRAVRASPWFVVAVIPAVLVWWDLRLTDAWVVQHEGEIRAWLIARFGWADSTPVFTVETWLSRWFRWAFAPIVSLSLLNELVAEGPRALRRIQWIRRALHWRMLGTATLVFVLLFALPWQLTSWRPELPPTWVETAVAAARLTVAGVAIILGCAVLVAAMVKTQPEGRVVHQSGSGE